MEQFPITEVHQVGTQMVHLVRDRIQGAEEYLGLIEGGGVCLAQSFPTPEKAEKWVRNMFGRLFPKHQCGFGCIRLPGSQFLAEAESLNILAQLQDAHPE